MGMHVQQRFHWASRHRPKQTFVPTLALLTSCSVSESKTSCCSRLNSRRSSSSVFFRYRSTSACFPVPGSFSSASRGVPPGPPAAAAAAAAAVVALDPIPRLRTVSSCTLIETCASPSPPPPLLPRRRMVLKRPALLLLRCVCVGRRRFSEAAHILIEPATTSKQSEAIKTGLVGGNTKPGTTKSFELVHLILASTIPHTAGLCASWGEWNAARRLRMLIRFAVGYRRRWRCLHLGLPPSAFQPKKSIESRHKLIGTGLNSSKDEVLGIEALRTGVKSTAAIDSVGRLKCGPLQFVRGAPVSRVVHSLFPFWCGKNIF